MSYNNAIPQPTDLISNSQAQILGNFAAIDSGTTGTGIGFARNHITMTDATNGGLHNRVDYYQNVTDPTISGFVSSIYAKLSGGLSQLTFRNSSQIMQVGGPYSAAASGYCYLFGGIIVQWGVGATTGSGVAFPLTFPNNAFSMVVTGSSTLYTGGFVVSALSTSQFTVSRTTGSGATGYYFVAFGN